MWRALALSVLLAACSGDGPQATVDALPVLRTGTFTPLLCIGGNPGDPTCPLTIVDLSGIGVAARFSFVAQPLSQDLYLSDLQLAGTVHIDGLYLEWWNATASGPAGSILLAASVDGGATLPSQAVLGVGVPTKLSLRFDAVTSQ